MIDTDQASKTSMIVNGRKTKEILIGSVLRDDGATLVLLSLKYWGGFG